jgi:flagellar biosynthetic protein FliP
MEKIHRPKKWRRICLALLIASLFIAGIDAAQALAAPIQIPNINLQVGGGTDKPQDLSSALQIIILLTVLSLAPAIVIMLTSFTRIIVVLAFLRSSLATQQMPPNQILIGLALFLTLFIMAPTLQQVNKDGLRPYLDGKITQQQAFTRGMAPMRSFMIKQTREKDLALFVKMAKLERPKNFMIFPIMCLSRDLL